MVRAGIALSMVLLFASGAVAGWLGYVGTGAGERLGGRAVRDAADRAYESVRDSIGRRDDSGGGASAGATDRGGAVAPAGKREPDRMTGIRPADISSGCDFIPGSRVLFFDDFRNTAPGGFPARWTLKGPDGNPEKAPLEVVRYGGRNWVRYRPSNEREDALTSFYIRMDAGRDLPDRFTVEFDAVLPSFDGKDRKPEYRVLLINHGKGYRSRDYEATSSNVVRIGSCGASAGSVALPFERGDGQVHRVAILVDGRSVRAYLDGEPVVDDPGGIVRPVTVVGIELAYQTGADILPLMFTDFRLAAAGAVTARTPSGTSRSGPAPASLP
jgi:hypothetical protein